MDYNAAIQYLSHNLNPVNVGLFVLLIVSEILGSNDKIKASSIYLLGKAMLQTFVDQVWPKPLPAPTTSAPTTTTTPQQ